MPAMAKIAATICREKEREEEEHQRKIDATRCVVIKTAKPLLLRRDTAGTHGRHSSYSLQKSQASEDKGCKGIINMWVLFYCQQADKLQAHTQMKTGLRFTAKCSQHRRGSIYRVGLIVSH